MSAARLRSRSHPRPSPARGRAPQDIPALLDAFDRCTTTEERARIGVKLAISGDRDPRVRAACVRMLDDDPLNGAMCVSALGDRTAVLDLSRALDRLVAHPVADCEICQAEHLLALVTAVRQLGGTLRDEQLEAVEAAWERANALWLPVDGGSGGSDEESANPPGGGKPGRGRLH